MKTQIRLIFFVTVCLGPVFLGCGDADYFIEEETIFFDNPKNVIKSQDNNKELDLGEEDSSEFARFYNYRRNTNIGHPTISSWSYYIDPGIGYPLPLIDHPYYTRAFFSDWLYRYYSY